MPNLWLTYAWKDNEDSDVDFVAGRLEERGISVRVDRTRLLTGRRLWQQIGEEFRQADVDGWAIYATENSLRSEPCQEELAYALDRALRSKGSDFPLIGIFPTPLDQELIPSSIAVRAWVHLKDDEWSFRVGDALGGKNTRKLAKPGEVQIKTHSIGGSTVVEIRPREGNWYPASVLVPLAEAPLLTLAWKGPCGTAHISPPMFRLGDTKATGPDGSEWKGLFVDEQIDSTCALYARFKAKPSRIAVGPNGRVGVYNL